MEKSKNQSGRCTICLQQEKELIITQLWLMIGAMSAGPSIIIILMLGGITTFYLAKLIKSCLHKISAGTEKSYSFLVFYSQYNNPHNSQSYNEYNKFLHRLHCRSYFMVLTCTMGTSGILGGLVTSLRLGMAVKSAWLKVSIFRFLHKFLHNYVQLFHKIFFFFLAKYF